MMQQYIYECFKDDSELLEYFDPLSVAENNEQAASEVYYKLLYYGYEYKCHFVKLDCGYFFYAKRRWFQRSILISFCIKKHYRTAYWKDYFWSTVRKSMGKRFVCYLYSRNTRAISFLLKMGMQVEKTNNLITLLSI